MGLDTWAAVGRRAVQGLGVQPRGLVAVRDQAGRYDVLQAMLLAVEAAGATPMVEVLAPDHVASLLTDVGTEYLAAWDRRRSEWAERVDRVLVLSAMGLSEMAPAAPGWIAWSDAIHRLFAIEERRSLPFLLVGVPTAALAARLGMELPALESAVLPALQSTADELRAEIDRVLRLLAGHQHLTVLSGGGHELHMELGDRRWLTDDGVVDSGDLAVGSIVSNLPAGSVYTTVLEDRTWGSIVLPRAGQARDVILRFVGGSVDAVQAAEGGDSLVALLDRHGSGARRVSHLGIGLNPRLRGRAPLGWTLVDEHMHGALFVALGENRYMRGQNASTLNVDYVVPEATLLADGVVIAEALSD